MVKYAVAKVMVFPIVIFWGYSKKGTQKLSANASLLCNCRPGEDFWESHGQQGDQSSQSWRKSIWLTMEGLMLNVKSQHFGHLRPRAETLGKTMILGKIEGRWRREQQRTRCLQIITDPMDKSLSKFWVIWRNGWHGVPQYMDPKESEKNWATNQNQKNWYWQGLGDGS